jgi:hypothetical protein
LPSPRETVAITKTVDRFIRHDQGNNRQHGPHDAMGIRARVLRKFKNGENPDLPEEVSGSWVS